MLPVSYASQPNVRGLTIVPKKAMQNLREYPALQFSIIYDIGESLKGPISGAQGKGFTYREACRVCKPGTKIHVSCKCMSLAQAPQINRCESLMGALNVVGASRVNNVMDPYF